jgi:RHS repeat-associated protein
MRKIKIMLALLWAYALTMSAQDIQYLPLHDDAAINGKTVNTALPVGFTAGALNVSPTGGASYTIPIALPPGTKGVVPSISIGYNSQGGNGIMGMGWNIAGLSAITRTGKNLHYDGEVTAVKLNYEDYFALDGNRLEATSAGIYNTKAETFSKVAPFGSSADSPNWFKVETKSGITYEYGNTVDSKFFDKNGSIVMSWQVNKMYDQYGNYVTYVYERTGDEMRIKEINYTGSANFLPYNKVAFSYKNRLVDKTTQYIAGSPVALNSLLTKIVVYTEGSLQVKKYAFEYGQDHIHSFLNNVKEYGSDNSELNSTIFKYGNPVITMNQVTSQEFIGEIVGTGDFNGDGLKDVLTGTFITHSTGAKFLDKLRVYRKNNNSDGLFTLSYSKQMDNSGDVRTIYRGWDINFVNSIAQDFNGDGRDDIMLLVVKNFNSTDFKYTDAYFDIFQANATATDFLRGNINTNAEDALSRSLAFSDGTNCWGQIPAKNNYLKFGDFDGDGKTDILAILEKCLFTNNGQDNIKAFLFTPGSRFSSACGGSCLPYPVIIAPGSASEWLNSDDLSVLDFDGDGKMDIMTTTTLSSGKTQKKVFRFLNTTVGSINGTNKVADLIYSSLELPKGEKEFKVADFNGDGKSDIVGFNKVTNTWYVYKSTGNGLVSQGNLPFDTQYSTDELQYDAIDGGKRFSEFEVADFNGDGLSDVLLTKSTFQIIYSSPKHMKAKISSTIYFSTGNAFTSKVFLDNRIVDNVVVFPPWGKHFKVNQTISDFNGDGKPDILRSCRYVPLESGIVEYGFPECLSFNPLSKDGTLDKIADGFKQVSQIGYKYLTEDGVYTKSKASVYPVNVLRIPIKVASSVIVPNGIGGTVQTTYAYENAQVHRRGLGFLGFSKFESSTYNLVETSPTKIHGTRSTTEFKIIKSVTTPEHFANVVDKQTVKNISNEASLNNELLSETTNTYSFQTNGTRYWQKLDMTTSKNIKTGVTNVATYIYDVNGNVANETAIVKTANNANEEMVTSIKSFTGTYGTTVPAHPESVVVSKKRSNMPFPTEVGNVFTYNTKGEVTNKIDITRELGIPTDLSSTFYHYNAMGLVISTSMYSNGIAPRYSSNTYDAKGRFALTSTNTLNQTASKTYDPRWGSVLTETDITGLLTRYTYDGFGRVTNIQTPQGHNIGTQYAWSYNAQYLPIKCYDIITSVPGKPSTWDIYDVMGRKTVATHEGYGNTDSRWVSVYSVTEYDARGNVANKTTPVNGTDWADREYTYFQYDHLNRLTSESNPTLGTTTYGYTYNFNAGQSTVTVTTPAPASQVSSKTTDATGKVISTTDHGGTLTFDYDNRGNQTSVKMNGTVATSMIYDRRGFQTSMTDQNSGTTQYLYDNYGQLKWQKDARNSEYTMNYDNLGRLTTRTGPEGTTTNEYVTSGNGLNAIKKITSFNGLLQEYTYDNWHRIATATETIDGTAYTKSFTYNAFNDIATTTYPSGLVITNSYSAETNGSTGVIKQDGYLNMVTANNGQVLFDGTQGDMSGFGKWRNYTLGNGATSNITYNHFAMPETYRAGNNNDMDNIQNLVLDWNLQTGNLTSRNDVVKSKTESFTYDNLNRLTGAQVAGLQQYYFSDYDNNGNISVKNDAGLYLHNSAKPNAVTDLYYNPNVGATVSTETQDIEYTKFQRPEKITEGGYEMTFMYASDYERRKTELTHKGDIVNTRYYMGDYEINVKDGVTQFIHYISGGDGLCAIVVQEGIGSAFQYFFPYTDHLGSILTVTDDNGNVAAEQNFDAWGRKRNVDTWEYDKVGAVPTWLYRGFTGHEHLPEFGLINMNARLYDPVLGRMLSADNFVGSGTQGLNRYSYANNNPLKFTDPSGNNPLIVAMAVYGAVNYASQALQGNVNNWNDAFKAFGLGAVQGAIVFASGGAADPLIALVSAASSQIPAFHIPVGDNLTLSLSPSIVAGSGLSLGLNVGASFDTDYGSIGFSLGLSYNFSHYASGTSFWEQRLGYGYAIGGRDFRAGLSTSNFSGGGFEQRTGSVNFSGAGGGGWSVSYENDGYPFGKLGNGAHPETDEYRSAAVAIRVGDFSAGFSIFTGHRDMAADMKGDNSPGYPNGIVANKEINDYKYASLYAGIGNYRIGKNHYEIGHQIQNRFAHNFAKPQRYIPWRPDAPANRATYYPNKSSGGYFSPNPYTNW